MTTEQTAGEQAHFHLLDRLMREAGLRAIKNADYREATGQAMTRPEQDEYDAAIRFGRLCFVFALASPQPASADTKATGEQSRRANE